MEPKEPGAEPSSSLPASPEAGDGPADAPKALTAEEQMKLFEKELKETDWGHQPC